MPHVLRVAALELGDPVSVLVHAEPQDSAHGNLRALRHHGLRDGSKSGLTVPWRLAASKSVG